MIIQASAQTFFANLMVFSGYTIQFSKIPSGKSFSADENISNQLPILYVSTIFVYL